MSIISVRDNQNNRWKLNAKTIIIIIIIIIIIVKTLIIIIIIIIIQNKRPKTDQLLKINNYTSQSMLRWSVDV